MQKEVLVVDAIDSVQEQYHGRLVVWNKTGRHLWLYSLTLWITRNSGTNEDERATKNEERNNVFKLLNKYTVPSHLFQKWGSGQTD